MNIVAEQTAEWDNAKGQAVTENIITANPNLKALFASNDNMALGAIAGAEERQVLDQVMVVGFDGNPEAAEAILDGDMAISVAQRPTNMGALRRRDRAQADQGRDAAAGGRHGRRARHEGQRGGIQVGPKRPVV